MLLQIVTYKLKIFVLFVLSSFLALLKYTLLINLYNFRLSTLFKNNFISLKKNSLI